MTPTTFTGTPAVILCPACYRPLWITIPRDDPEHTACPSTVLRLHLRYGCDAQVVC